MKWHHKSIQHTLFGREKKQFLLGGGVGGGGGGSLSRNGADCLSRPQKLEAGSSDLLLLLRGRGEALAGTGPVTFLDHKKRIPRVLICLPVHPAPFTTPMEHQSPMQMKYFAWFMAVSRWFAARAVYVLRETCRPAKRLPSAL